MASEQVPPDLTRYPPWPGPCPRWIRLASGASETIEAGRPRTACGWLLGPRTEAARAFDPRLAGENWSQGAGRCREHVPMLLYLTGSSCSGKTTLALAAARRIPSLAVHDVDEPGAPPEAQSEHWIQHALECQRRGTDLLLAGQAPLGEILAAPSAPLLEGIAVCLVDVADHVRRERLAQRQPGRWEATAVEDFINWAAWHRGHAADPGYEPELLLAESRKGEAWHRWTAWSAEDPRWSTHVLDTTHDTVERSVDRAEVWITEQRQALRAGHLALSHGWDHVRPTGPGSAPK